MNSEKKYIGIDVSRDWLDGIRLPDGVRFRLPNVEVGFRKLEALIEATPGPVKIGFEATGGHEWLLWERLAAAGRDVVQLPPAQVKAFARSQGTRAKTDRIDAEMIARFMAFRPGAGRSIPNENLRILRSLTTRRAQLVEMRKRLRSQAAARNRQGDPAELASLDDDLIACIESQIRALDGRIAASVAEHAGSAERARLLRSVPGFGPVCVAMLIAEMPELGEMTAGEAAAMAGLAPISRDSGAMRGRRMIAGGRIGLRQVLYQAALAAACHNPALRPVAERLKERGKPHKLVIVAIARRLIIIANAILKSGSPWRPQPAP